MTLREMLDACVWSGAVDAIRAQGHDVACVGELEKDPGDTVVLEMARRERRVLVTLDRDFGELAVVRGSPHAGIVRLVGLRSRQQGPAAIAALEVYADELAASAIVTVEPGRVRIRPGTPPIRE